MVKPIPDGYHTVTPYLSLSNAGEAIKFYEKALGAKELYRLPMGDKIGHAELRIGDSNIMLADESPAYGNKSAKTLGGSPVGIAIYLADVDAATQRFIDAGGKVVRPIEDQFYGDRTCTLIDPEGYKWTLCTHVEDVSPEEMGKRMAKMGEGGGDGGGGNSGEGGGGG